MIFTHTTYTRRLPRGIVRFLVVLCCLVSLAACTSPRVDTSTNTWPTTPNVTEMAVYFDTWCTEGCVTLAQWNSLISDGYLRGAADIAYDRNAQWRALAQSAAMSGTTVSWAELQQSIGGHFVPYSNAIEISNALRGEPSSVLAAVISHEIAHAAFYAARGMQSSDSYTCYTEELYAYQWEASTWQVARLGTEWTSYSQWENDLLVRWQSQQIREFVVSSPLYQEECLGEELPNY